MSLVSVHGPNMWGGTGAGGGGTGPAVDNAGGTVTADMSNGRKFSLVGKGNRNPVDYDWTFNDGTAAINDTKSTTVTFATGGAKIITLTVGSTGGTTPPATTYTYNVTATATAMPRSVREGGGEEPPPEEQPPEEPPVFDEDYDPGDYTVAEVVAYANTLETAEEVGDLIDSERLGKNRTTLISQLESIAESL